MQMAIAIPVRIIGPLTDQSWLLSNDFCEKESLFGLFGSTWWLRRERAFIISVFYGFVFFTVIPRLCFQARPWA